MEHSIKAGLMITSASDYNMEICRGANEACKELGIELVIFFLVVQLIQNVKFCTIFLIIKSKCLCFCKLFRFRFLVIPASSICRNGSKNKRGFSKIFSYTSSYFKFTNKDYPFVVYNNKKLFMML